MTDDQQPRSSLPECMTLRDVRASIDDVDERIVALLAERRGYALQAARFKSAADGVKDPAREEQVVANVRALAAAEDRARSRRDALPRHDRGLRPRRAASGAPRAPDDRERQRRRVRRDAAAGGGEAPHPGVRAGGADGRRGTPHAGGDPRSARSAARGHRGPLLDPRHRGRARLCPAAARARGGGLRHAVPRHARLLREAAHVRGVGGADERPADERLVPGEGGDGACAALPPRGERPRPSHGDRGARPHLAALPRRSRDLDRHRRAHLRVADAPEPRVRPRRPSASRTARTARSTAR